MNQLYNFTLLSMSLETFNPSIAIMILTLNIISACSLIFVMTIYVVKWNKIANFPLRLVFYLSIACLWQNIYVFIMTPTDVRNRQINGVAESILCNVEASMKTSADLSSIVWTYFIIYSAYASVVLKKEVEKYQKVYLLGGFLVPLILGIIPAAFDLYGYSAYYCWFNTQNATAGLVLKLLFYYVPLWIMFVMNMVLAVKTYNCLKALNIDQKDLKVFKRLLLFPVILVLVGFWSTVHKIYQIASNYQELQWLSIMDYLFFSLYGFFNALAYGFNPTIRAQITNIFCKNQQGSQINRSQSNNTQKINKQIFLQQFQ